MIPENAQCTQLKLFCRTQMHCLVHEVTRWPPSGPATGPPIRRTHPLPRAHSHIHTGTSCCKRALQLNICPRRPGQCWAFQSHCCNRLLCNGLLVCTQRRQAAAHPRLHIGPMCATKKRGHGHCHLLRPSQVVVPVSKRGKGPCNGHGALQPPLACRLQLRVHQQRQPRRQGLLGGLWNAAGKCRLVGCWEVLRLGWGVAAMTAHRMVLP